MFTGIVTEFGVVRSINEMARGRDIVIAAHESRKDLVVGDSVAVNGVCLTVADLGADEFSVHAVHETLARSTCRALAPGDPVNLERPMAAGGRFDGHIVQGHVDGVGTVVDRAAEGDSERLRIGLPSDLEQYVVEKGSVAVDGVSLTITAVAPAKSADPWFEVALIPHTMDVTVLGTHRPVGSAVNVEVDVLAKYVERMMERQS